MLLLEARGRPRPDQLPRGSGLDFQTCGQRGGGWGDPPNSPIKGPHQRGLAALHSLQLSHTAPYCPAPYCAVPHCPDVPGCRTTLSHQLSLATPYCPTLPPRCPSHTAARGPRGDGGACRGADTALLRPVRETSSLLPPVPPPTHAAAARGQEETRKNRPRGWKRRETPCERRRRLGVRQEPLPRPRCPHTSGEKSA